MASRRLPLYISLLSGGFACLALILLSDGQPSHARTNPPTTMLIGDQSRVRVAAAPSDNPSIVPLNDAFARLDTCPISVTTGMTFTVDLRINSGTHTVVGQQSYLTFTNSLLQVIDPAQPGCVAASAVQPDGNSFEVTLQNAVDNANGEIAYASGTFGPGVPPNTDFRVARITFCAVATGTAVLHWQFQPPNRISKITDDQSMNVHNPVLYQDCTFAVNCALSPDYQVTVSAGATIVPGTSRVPGTTCDSCTVLINLPFSYSFYGTPYSQARVSNKGVVQFVSNSANGSDTCLPAPVFNDAIFVYWDDHNTNINDTMGIFTSTTGTAPNRILNMEWRSGYVANDVRSRYEVRLYEGEPKFETIYATTRRGFSATVGVQKGTGERFTQYACNTNNSVPNGTKITWDQRVCPGRSGAPGKP